MQSRRVWRVLALVGFSLTTVLGADAPWQKGIIVFREVVPKQSAPPEGSKLHWVITALPGLPDIRLPDDEAARLIHDWLLEKSKAEHDWLMDSKTSWSLPDLMSRELDRRYEIKRSSAQFLNPPTLTNTSIHNAELPILFHARPALPGIAGLNIRVATEAAANSSAEKVQLALGDLAPHVTAWGEAAASEIDNEQDTGAIKAALRGVAEQGWAVSRSHGIVVGAKPDEATFRRRKQDGEEELHALYAPAGRGFENLNWPVPERPIYQRDEPLEEGRWVLFIRKVRVVRETKVEVPLVAVSTKGSPEQVERGQCRAKKLKVDTETTANSRLRVRLDSIRNTVPTVLSLRAVLSAVEAEPSLRPPAHAESDGQTIRFIAQDSHARFGFETTIEGGWSPEDRLFGKGTFHGDNLLRFSDQRKQRVESETLSFSGGSEVHQFNGAWQLATTKDTTRRAVLRRTLSFAGQIRYDRNQALGNPEGTRFSLDSRRIGPYYTIEYGSSLRTDDGKPKALVLGWKSVFEPYLGFGSVQRQEGFAPGQGSVASGSFFAFALEEELQLTWRLRPVERGGIGQIGTRLRLLGQHSPDWIDYSFRTAEASAEAEVKFGFSHSRDYLVRYRLGMATASKNAPLFELPRLGGPDVLRGLEQGEQIGRKMGYAQFTAGPSLENMVTWFGRTRPADARLGPLKLSDVYVTGFVDRGAVYERSSLTDLLWPSGAIGYGVEVEMQNLSIGTKRARLGIGYGYSPDSLRHPRGFTVTSLAIDLN